MAALTGDSASIAEAAREPPFRRQRLGFLLALPAFLAAVIIFAIELRALSAINGWWLDELFSLWETDPAVSFLRVLGRLRQATPPLYDVLLYGVRQLISDPRAAVIVLNLSVLAAGFAIIFASARKAGMLAWVLLLAAALLCTGAFARYTIEGRTYLLAMTLALLVSWFCSLAILTADKRPRLAVFLLLSVLCAAAHTFAALLCGCLAAGMLTVALIGKRGELIRPALALALPAGVLALGFTLWTLNRVPHWMKFDSPAVYGVYRELKTLGFGSGLGLALFGCVLIEALVARPTRRLAVMFGIAWVLFAAVPIAISLRHPAMTGRYFLIAAPSFFVFAVLSMREMLAAKAGRGRVVAYRSVALAALSFMLAADAGGYPAARWSTGAKAIWSGADLVAPHLHECPAGTIHVFPEVVDEFTVMVGAPPGTFVSALWDSTRFVGVKDSPCPVLGWAEHIFEGEHPSKTYPFVSGATAEELLHILKIDALPSQVSIARHWSGYVVMKR
jgi:hypothetical protein